MSKFIRLPVCVDRLVLPSARRSLGHILALCSVPDQNRPDGLLLTRLIVSCGPLPLSIGDATELRVMRSGGKSQQHAFGNIMQRVAGFEAPYSTVSWNGSSERSIKVSHRRAKQRGVGLQFAVIRKDVIRPVGKGFEVLLSGLRRLSFLPVELAVSDVRGLAGFVRSARWAFPGVS